MDKALARGGAVWHDPLLPYKQLNRHSPDSGGFASRIALVTSSDNGKSPLSREKGGRTRRFAAPNAVMRRFVGTEAYSHGRLPVKRCHFIFFNSSWLYWHPGLSLVLDLVVSQPVPTHIRSPFSATAAPKSRFRRAQAQEDETLLLIGD